MAGMRGKQTVRGMIQSLAVILIAAGVMYLFIPHDESKDPVKRVDYRVELLTAQRAAPYPVVAPHGLSQDWKPTSVRYRGDQDNAWHLAFLDPDEQYVAIEQSTSAKADEFAGRVSQDAKNTGKTQQVGGETWQRWDGPKYRALVRTDKGATTVVTGTASYERLGEMAQALRSQGPTASAAPKQA
ncbi:DUF4245 domain-containing protein [Streptomyces sp. NPDC001941]|uniref:DUF4245 domain-containing protein n=1 Tax=Streptomyces sp. NPDC001941 TaxID=3154659 RepID=UPI00331BCD50